MKENKADILPSDIDAERYLLGSILLAPECIALITDTLRSAHFYRDSHRTIYEAMLHIYDRRDLPEQFTVCDLLSRQDRLESVGGDLYVGLLLSDEHCSQWRIEEYATRIKNAYKRRRLQESGALLVQLAHTAENADEAVATAEEEIYSIARSERSSDVVGIDQVGQEFYQWFETMPQGGAIVGVPTGLEVVDRKMGGMQKTDLIVLAGRPSMGKTSLAMTLAKNSAKDYGCGTLIFSLEMNRAQLFQRMVAQEADVDLSRLRMGLLSEQERDRVTAKTSMLMALSIWIDHTPAISISSLRSRIRRTMAQHQVDVVVVDYLQKMTATQDGKRIRDRYQEVSEVARGLKDIAKEFDIPVLALAQLNREVEHRAEKIPQLSDLRDTGEIEQEADIVLFIYRDDYYAGKYENGQSKSDRPGTADIVFAKYRNGSTGEVRLGFQESRTRFYTLGKEAVYERA